MTLDDPGSDGSHTSLHHAVFESITARDAHGHGWSETFDRLAAHVTNV